MQHVKGLATFRSLCLVSKRFLDLARPFIFRIICLPASRIPGTRLPSRLDLDPTLAKATRMGNIGVHTRTLFLELPPYERNCRALKELTECVPNLEVLFYVSDLAYEQAKQPPSFFTFSCLYPLIGSSKFSLALTRSRRKKSGTDARNALDIKRLHLTGVMIPPMAPFSFPLVKELSFHQVILPHNLQVAYHLPSLVHLVYSSDDSLPQIPEINFLMFFAPRLATLSLAFPTTPDFGVGYNSPSDDGFRILVVLPVLHRGADVLLEAEIRHLRFIIEPNFTRFVSDDANSNANKLSTAIDTLQNLKKLESLRMLYLPGDLNPGRLCLSWEMRKHVNRLVALCARNQVEIIWEGMTMDQYPERLLSREFAERSEQAQYLRESEGWSKGRISLR